MVTTTDDYCLSLTTNGPFNRHAWGKTAWKRAGTDGAEYVARGRKNKGITDELSMKKEGAKGRPL